ncbi:MAG: SpoIIE family protein phosphatase, partial [Nocardioides sp.]|nr:SpoIIE family protein phosphatase [Nocardioides sp.]
MTTADLLSRTFAPAPTSVSEARRFARTALLEWGLESIVDDVVLLVSELVTNAVKHAGTPTTVAVVYENEQLRVDVVDLHPTRVLPVGANARPGAGEHGRGLLITATLATAWGVEYRKDHKRVWAAFALVGEAIEAGAQLPGAAVELDVRPREAAPPADSDPLGLRSVALNRLSLDDVLVLVVQQTRERLVADAAYLLLEEEVEERFTVAATSGLPFELRGRRVLRGEPGAPRTRSPLPLQISDLEETPVDLLAGVGLRSLVIAPVTYDGRVIGALAIGRRQVAAFTDDDAAQLQRAADWAAATVDRARMRDADRERRGWLGFIADAGVMLASSLDLDTTITMTGQIVVPRLAVWCGVYLNDPRGRPSLRYAWHADENHLDEVREALERWVPEKDVPTRPELTGEVSVLPLEARSRVIGWLVLGRPTGEHLLGERLLVAGSIARRAALAIDNAIAHAELQEIGQTLQQSLLPVSLPEIPGVDIGVVYQPAGEHNAAGGDFYDFFALGGARWCFVVGDVCGTGAEAAGVTGLARHTIRALMRSGLPLAATLERLNEAIRDEGPRGRFITLVAGTIETTMTGQVRLRMVCA